MGARKAVVESKTQDREVEVLYQKIGNRWYAFSLIDEEMFFTPVPEEAIDPEFTVQPGQDIRARLSPKAV